MEILFPQNTHIVAGSAAITTDTINTKENTYGTGTINLEHSGKEFKEKKEHYRHHARQVFDTNLNLELLQEYIYIPLDIFLDLYRKNNQNIDKELDAWLLFLASDHPADITRLVGAYPMFRELYGQIAAFQQKPEELVNMYSNALEIMDLNTVKYMIEEQKRELEEVHRALVEKNTALAEQRKQMEALKRELEKYKTNIK